MVTDNIALRHIEDLVLRYPALKESAGTLGETYSILKNCFEKDHILFCAGNGGSAADCEHLVGELMKGFILRRRVPSESQNVIREKTGDAEIGERLQQGLRSISLISHPSLNTAYMNDVDPSMIYAQQLFVLGRPGDCVIGFSTSGGAQNICNMFKIARSKDIKTILFTGLKHGICENFADLVVRAPEKETYKVQEYHLPMYHSLCMMLEEAFYGKQ